MFEFIIYNIWQLYKMSHYIKMGFFLPNVVFIIDFDQFLSYNKMPFDRLSIQQVVFQQNVLHCLQTDVVKPWYLKKCCIYTLRWSAVKSTSSKKTKTPFRKTFYSKAPNVSPYLINNLPLHLICKNSDTVLNYIIYILGDQATTCTCELSQKCYL